MTKTTKKSIVITRYDAKTSKYYFKQVASKALDDPVVQAELDELVKDPEKNLRYLVARPGVLEIKKGVKPDDDGWYIAYEQADFKFEKEPYITLRDVGKETQRFETRTPRRK